MDNGFRILERLIHLINARHGVIASNIANVDTPNYKAKDIKFKQVFDDVNTTLAVTDHRHFREAGSGISGGVEVNDVQPWIDKNNVELDIEVAKMTENTMLFQAGITLLSKKIKMFKDALRSR